MTKGVFSDPPKVRFPTLITGSDALFGGIIFRPAGEALIRQTSREKGE